MITLKDIAQQCGKTVSTVSRALRDDPRVTAKTRELIQSLAEELGYSPNLAARRLVVGSSQTIWFVMANLSYPLSQVPAQSASIALHEDGYDLLIAPYHGDHEALFRIIDRLGQGVCDAAIMIPGPSCISEKLGSLVRNGYPLVFLDRHLEGVPAPVVTTNNEAAAKELATRCFDAGAEAIVSLFSTINPVEKARQKGTGDAAKQRKLAVLSDLEDLPDNMAVIGSSQASIHDFIRRNAGRLAGRRLQFATFDAWAGGSQPAENAFVCIQDMETMGWKAAEHLTRRLSGKTKRVAFRRIIVPYKEIRVVTPLG